MPYALIFLIAALVLFIIGIFPRAAATFNHLIAAGLACLMVYLILTQGIALS